MIEFGTVSLKMILFVIAMTISFFSLRNINGKDVFRLQSIFLLVLAIGFVNGAFSEADPNLIFEDIKPLLFLFMVNFFAININSINDIKKVSSVIKFSSLIMAIAYLLIVVGLNFGFIDFSKFYEEQSETSEIFFRGENFFFYKGFLYLGIGFLFYLLERGFRNQVCAFIVFVSLCLTLTRGFIIAAFLLYLYYIFFVTKSFFLRYLAVGLSIAGLFYFVPILIESLGDKSASDLIRIITVDQVLDKINFYSLFFGHGFGVGVVIRPVHMEISFLEIFHKQGLVGLFFWFGFLFFLFNKFRKIKSVKLKQLGLPFLLSVFFVYIQSFTNPFVNNPIGISILIISFIVIIRLENLDKFKIKSNNS